MARTTDSVREAALLYSGDDAACTQTKVEGIS